MQTGGGGSASACGCCGENVRGSGGSEETKRQSYLREQETGETGGAKDGIQATFVEPRSVGGGVGECILPVLSCSMTMHYRFWGESR